MTLERLQSGTLAVPFDPANNIGNTVLVNGTWQGEFGNGAQGRIEMELDPQSPFGPIIADLDKDGATEAIVAIFRQSLPSGPTVVAVISDDAIAALVYVDYTGPVNDIVLRPGLRSLRLVESEIELTVTPNFVLEDPSLETQRYAFQSSELLRVA